METVGTIFGLVAFVWCCTLYDKVAKMERAMREAGIGGSEKKSLKEVLMKNVGKYGKPVFKSGTEDAEIINVVSQIVDVDTDWILLESKAKKIRKLIRIDSIQGFEFEK